MKKLILLTLTLLLLTTGCAKTQDDKTIKVGASPSPHGAILEAAKPVLEELGYTLEVVEFVDYVQPNIALNDGKLDANFFQHLPYLEKFNEEQKTKLSSVLGVHFEPMGIYGGKSQDLANIKEGAIIAVPNDTTNEARALQLLEANGIIKLEQGKGLLATAKDIVENPKNLVIKEIEAAQIPRSLPDVDFGVINGNYALEADISPSTALVLEDKTAEAAQTFANIIAVQTGKEQSEKTKALIEALQSEEVTKFINETYTDGSVIPVV